MATLCDADGNRLFNWPPSEAFFGDSLRHLVRFSGRDDLGAFPGKTIRLGFDLSDAELYSFAFRLNLRVDVDSL